MGRLVELRRVEDESQSVGLSGRTGRLKRISQIGDQGLLLRVHDV